MPSAFKILLRKNVEKEKQHAFKRFSFHDENREKEKDRKNNLIPGISQVNVKRLDYL